MALVLCTYTHKLHFKWNGTYLEPDVLLTVSHCHFPTPVAVERWPVVRLSGSLLETDATQWLAMPLLRAKTATRLNLLEVTQDIPIWDTECREDTSAIAGRQCRLPLGGRL